MSNKNGFSKTTNASDSKNVNGLNEPQKSENNFNNTGNLRYSLSGGIRNSIGSAKAGRLSNSNNEFADSSKLSLGGRNSISANESRASLSRYTTIIC